VVVVETVVKVDFVRVAVDNSVKSTFDGTVVEMPVAAADTVLTVGTVVAAAVVVVIAHWLCATNILVLLPLALALADAASL
jgi:hypothetical protein